MNLAVVLVGGSRAAAGRGHCAASVGSATASGGFSAAPGWLAIEEAVELAAREPKYVRVSGRISSDEEFPDDKTGRWSFAASASRSARHGQWRTIVDEREAVTFGVETRVAFIAVDEWRLGEGVVVIPRVSTGTVGDLPADLGADRPAGTGRRRPA